MGPKDETAFEKNKSKNNGTAVRVVAVELNPKNLDTKVVTYDPTKERASKFWTVLQAIQELEKLAEPQPVETSLEGEKGELGEMDNIIVQCGEIEGEISIDLSCVSLQKEGSDDTGNEE